MSNYPKHKKPRPQDIAAEKRRLRMLDEYNNGLNTVEIAKIEGITRERVRQILTKAGYTRRVKSRTIKVYEVMRGWEKTYFINRHIATKIYKDSGESDKCLIEYTLSLTPELLINVLNFGSIDTSTADVLNVRILED